MFISIRKCKTGDSAEVARRVKEQFLERVSKVSGFRGYYQILCTPSVNPPRKQRVLIRPRSVNRGKTSLCAFTSEKRDLTCVNFPFLSSPRPQRNAVNELLKYFNQYVHLLANLGDNPFHRLGRAVVYPQNYSRFSSVPILVDGNAAGHAIEIACRSQGIS